MARDNDRKRPKRVSTDNVRNNAAKSGGKNNYFNLPKDMREWYPGEKGSFDIDIVEYEVKTKSHPDRENDALPGYSWYKYPFVVFRKVGINEDNIVSPASIGLPCPMMEKRNELCKEYKKNEKEIKDMGMQKWVAFIIKDPDEPKKLAVYADSIGKFWGSQAGLKAEIDSTDEENLLFYTLDSGKTIRARFGQIDFKGSDGKDASFIGCTKIEFRHREPMGDEWYEKIPCLDELFRILPYDSIKAMMEGLDVDDTDTGNEDGGKPAQTAKPRSATASGSASGKSGGKTKTPEPEPEAEEAEEPEEIEVGDTVSFKNKKGKVIKGKVSSIDGDDVTVTDANDNESDAEMDDLTLVEKGGDEAEEPEPEKDDAAEAPKGDKRIPKVGDRIKDDEGKEGTVTKVDAASEDVTVKRANGKEAPLDFSEIAEFLDDAEEPEEEEKTTPLFKVGDKVKWDDGSETGVITKILPDEAKVKNDDGSGIERVPLKKLSLNKKK